MVTSLHFRLRFAIGLLLLLVLVHGRSNAQESVYNGAFSGGSGGLTNALTFETDSGKGLSIINFFKNWDDSNGVLHFPTSTVTGMRNHGSIPMISWQPSGAGPDSDYSLAKIINGDFDDFITDWALAAKAWGHPFFLRFAHEMNGSWYPWNEGQNGNTTGQYVAMWRHVHDIFARNGVTNVTWVWCVNTKYSGSTPIAGLYPGDNYVDWSSLDTYNRLSNNWGSISTRAGATFTELLQIAPGKPIMIAEAGCHEATAVEENAGYSKAAWVRNAMKDYIKYSMPRVKAWCYFNGNNPDGNDWRITTSPEALAAYQESVGLSYFSDNKYGAIEESPVPPLLNDATTTDVMGPFVAIVKPSFNKVQAGALTEIYTSAADKSGVVKVEYSINGVLSHTENIAPYQYFWQVPANAGINYTIQCKAYDQVGLTTLSTIQVLSQNPPAPPSGVAATDGAFTDKVRVTWSPAAAATGYEVWRNTSNNSASATRLSAEPVAGTTFDDLTADYSTVYYYWVKSVDDAGSGGFSSSNSGYRDLPDVPAAPTGVYATDGIYNDKVLVGWNGVNNAAGYEIWRNTVNNSATAVKITTLLVIGTTYDDTTVPYASNYYYWVKAVNDGGASSFSGVGGGYRGSVPTISDVTNRTINQLADTGAIAVTVGDAETAVASLTLSASSSNIALVPAANISFGGSGANRTMTVTPAANQSGSTTLTITVTDADGGQASDSFLLTVNALPVIGAIADKAININSTTGAITFSLSDAETAAGSLTVSGTSSNTSVVPNANIVFGGSGASRTVSVTPAANKAGTAAITVTAGDGTGTSVATFFVSVVDANQALWTAMTTGSSLPWNTGANWFSGVAPASGSSTTLTFLAGSTLPAGSITSNNNAASPLSLNSLTLSGTGPAAAAGTMNLTGNTLNLVTAGDGSAPVINLAASAGSGAGAALTYQIGMPMTLGATVTVEGNGSATFVASGNISGAAGLSKAGSGLLVLAGSNSYTGATIIKGGGTLRVTNSSGLGTNGTLQINTGAVSPLIQLHLDGSGSAGTIVMSNGFGGNSNITTTIDVDNNGGIATGNVIKLNGATTGWGNNTILNVTGSHSYGLYISQLKSTGGSAGVQTLNPTTAALVIGAYSGANNATTLTLAGTNAGNSIAGSIVDGASVVSLVKSDSGTWLLGGSNSFTGTTNINAGTLVIAHGAALGNSSANTTIATSGGQLNLRDGIVVAEPLVIAGRSAGDHLVNESGNNTLTAPLTLGTGGNAYFVRSDSGKLLFSNSVTMTGSTATKTLNFSGAGDVEVSGSISSSSGVLSVIKSGAGSLKLSSATTYSGATLVNGGTLILNAALPASSGVVVGPAGKLSGAGSITANATIHGIHAPGSGIGLQAFAAGLTYSGTSHLEWELAGNTTSGAGANFDAVSADQLTISAGALLELKLNSAGSSVDFTNAFWKQQHTWSAVAANSVNGSLILGSISPDPAGHAAAPYGTFSLQKVGSSINVVWTPNSPFLAWQQASFGEDATDSEIAGEAADSDHDQLPNLVEYAIGTTPTVGNPGGITCRTSSTDVFMTYPLRKSAADVSVQPLWSTDLSVWKSEGLTSQVLTDDGTLQKIEARIPKGNSPHIYMRLRVTRP